MYACINVRMYEITNVIIYKRINYKPSSERCMRK